MTAIKTAPPTILSVPDSEMRIVGTVLHEALEQLAIQAPYFPSTEELDSSLYLWQQRLWQLGFSVKKIEAHSQIIYQSILRTLQDPRGQWILSADHLERQNEYVLNAVLNHDVVKIIIDRTFIDAQGVRWIIDYKTGTTQPYEDQLNRENNPIQLGVYFPMRRNGFFKSKG